MANKTYAQLTATTTVADGDLLATYSGVGPLKRITALLVQGYMQTGVIKADGSIPFTGAALLANGTEGSPGLTFNADPDTGFYRVGANDLGVSAGGVKQGEWTISGYVGRPSTAASAGFNLPAGTAPTAPTDGDIWTTTSGQFNRINGVTKTVAYTTSTVATADKWTTARTITLGGPLTGSVSIDGSADVTLTGAVTGKITTIAPTTGTAGFNLTPGVAPTSPTDGDFWVTSAGLFLRNNGSTAAILASQVILVQNRQTAGTGNPEPNASGNTWTQRTFNTTVFNTVSGASLSSNSVILPAGTYTFTFSTTANILISTGNQSGFLHRLYNATDSAVIDYSCSTSAINQITSGPSFTGAFTLTGTKTVEIDVYWITASGTILQMGSAISGGGDPLLEVYSAVSFQKIG